MSEVADSLAPWHRAATATISDALGRLHAMHAGIRLLSGDGLVGRAFTVETGAGDSATLHRALTEVPPDVVLVVDAAGHDARAVWGFVLSVAAQQRDVRGLVLDGVVRDLADTRAAGFPVFARGACPAGPHKGFDGRWGHLIQCGGIAVASGDLVVGDQDGVVVVPAARVEEAAARVAAIEEQERDLLAQVRAGARTADLLGLNYPPGAQGADLARKGLP